METINKFLLIMQSVSHSANVKKKRLAQNKKVKKVIHCIIDAMHKANGRTTDLNFAITMFLSWLSPYLQDVLYPQGIKT